MSLSVRDLRRFERAAVTIKSKAESLQSAMMQRVGPEHPLTDWGDNVVAETDNLLHSIDLCIANHPERRGRH